MHTFEQFKAITKRRFTLTKPATSEQDSLDNTNSFSLTPESHARVKALAHFLDMSDELLFEELVATALGDAHAGFLAAFTDDEQRQTANNALKQMVQLNLKHR